MMPTLTIPFLPMTWKQGPCHRFGAVFAEDFPGGCRTACNTVARQPIVLALRRGGAMVFFGGWARHGDFAARLAPLFKSERVV
jgi:hypothetical protein